MGIRAINLDKISKKYKNLEKNLVNNELMTKVATNAKAIIVTRTLKGESVNGGAFKEYSPEYKNQRAKKGRSLTPNLSWSGRMLSSITHKILSKTKVMLTFSRGEEGKKAYFNDQTRPFFSLNQQEMATINEKVIKPHIRKLL